MRGSGPIGAKIARVPGAAQHGAKRNDALQTRDRQEHRLCEGPGSAAHRFAIARAAPHPGHVTPFLAPRGQARA